jgi:hypothetical protein
MSNRDFHRSGRWHTATSEFRIMDGPTVVSVTETSVTIRWRMSEVCSGQVEWGYSSGSLPYTTTAQPITGGYAEHTQTISGVSPATAVYFRTKSTSAASVTVYSTVQTQTTDGTVPLPSGLGPRYSEYTGVAGGTFPTFPTGGNVVIMPASVLSASDKGLALGQWISAQADNAIMVLDRSGGGTAYGAGTEIVCNNNVYINPGTGVVKTGQTLWMYNTRIRNTNTSSSSSRAPTNRGANILLQWGGVYVNFSILGGTLMGPNTLTGTYACRNSGTESGHGIEWTAYTGLFLRDVRFRNIQGDAVNLAQWSMSSRYGNITYPSNCELGWCFVDGTSRQGIVPNQAYGLWIHHCEVYNSALSSYDSEDNIENPAPNRLMRDITIEDSVFRGMNWAIAPGTGLHNWFIMIVQQAAEVDVIDNIIIRRNRFEGGHSGWGNPDAEVAVLGSIQNGGAGNAGVHTMASPAPWYALSATRSATNLQFVDNVITLPPNQRNGYAIYLRNWHGVTITGNDLVGRPVRALDCSSVTFSGNSAGSTLVTS